MPLRLLLTALLYCIAVSVAHGAPQLNTHPFSEGARPDLDNRQLRWLWERRTLRLGVIDRENPPFEILGTGLSFEGITADYASLLAAQLRLQVKVKVYTSLDGAIKGLREGDINRCASNS